jgi:tetratricopeptide (TPR) repeat protein
MSHVRTAILQNQLGHFGAALAHAKLAIRARQGGAVPYLCAAFAAAHLPGNDGALAWLDQALVLEPRNGLALGARAGLLRELDRAGEGIENARQWVDLEPGNGSAYFCLAQLQRALGVDEEAVQSYALAVDLMPHPAEAMTEFGILLLELGRRDAGVQMVERALAADRNHAAAWYTRTETKSFAAGDPELQEMEDLLQRSAREKSPHAERDTILLRYALAKACADAGDAGRARVHLDAGSRLKRAGIDYDPNVDERSMAAIAAAFPKETVERLRQGGDPTQMPIFIVGMPRSGTTLVEQILASHSAIHGGGEAAHIDRLVRELGADYPQGMWDMPAGRISALGRRYLGMISPPHPASRATDKMPYNFLHLGLIHAMLPNARMVHCTRDPLDTCISCYSKLFTRGHEFSYELGELGRYYRNYSRLMQHWREVIPKDRLIDVPYEQVVNDIGTEARRLIDFCGLPWEESCLRFHETSRTVRTASLHQVRRPLYRGSLGHSKSFGQGLEILTAALAATQITQTGC